MQKKIKSHIDGEIAFSILLVVIMLFVVIVCFYPFVYMVMLSLSSGDVYGKALMWPVNFSSLAYSMIADKLDFFSNIWVSVLRSVMGPVLTTLIGFMAAYVLAQDDLIGRKVLSRVIVFSMYFSAGILPVYLNIMHLGLNRSFWVYVLPYAVNVYQMILIRTFIQGQPKALKESAVLDGANDLQIAFKIVFPLCKPVISAVVLFEFVNQWNMYTDTLLYNAQEPKLYTLQYILSNFLAKQMKFSATDFTSPAAMANFNVNSMKMAMAVIICVPVMIVYPFLQKYFVKGILVGSIKG